jgi:TPR repeat protein
VAAIGLSWFRKAWCDLPKRRAAKGSMRVTFPKASIQKVGAEEMYQRALALAKKGRERHAPDVLPLLKAATAAGHSMAAHALASWYIHGIGVRKNFATAVALEMKAARSGIVDAINNLAFAYEAGRGVEKDERRSFQLYRRAAALGDPGATYEVGRCFFYGIGTRRNERLGHEWIDKSKGMKITAKTSRDAPKRGRRNLGTRRPGHT